MKRFIIYGQLFIIFGQISLFKFLRSGITMLHNSPYVMNSFLEQFPELVTARGGDFNALCQQAALPVEAVTGRHQLIPFDNFIALLEAADEVLGYPEVSFDLARRQSIDTIGPVTQLISSCTRFGEAMLKIAEYLKILTSGFDIRVNSNDHYVELCFDIFVPALLPKRQFQNYLLASTVSVLRRVMKNTRPLRSCSFSRNETDARLRAIQDEFFGCPIRFGADEIKLTMDSAVLSEPVSINSASLQRKTMGFRPGSKALEDDLINAITSTLASGDVSLESTALSMGYSERTFRRRLNEAGISFSQALRSVRFEQANRYLQSTHYKLGDIAALLGYSNQSAFSRSYVTWCGMSPSAYRRGLETPTD